MKLDFYLSVPFGWMVVVQLSAMTGTIMPGLSDAFSQAATPCG